MRHDPEVYFIAREFKLAPWVVAEWPSSEVDACLAFMTWDHLRDERRRANEKTKGWGSPVKKDSPKDVKLAELHRQLQRAADAKARAIKRKLKRR